jgi:hypothetical protein
MPPTQPINQTPMPDRYEDQIVVTGYYRVLSPNDGTGFSPGEVLFGVRRGTKMGVYSIPDLQDPQWMISQVMDKMLALIDLHPSSLEVKCQNDCPGVSVATVSASDGNWEYEGSATKPDVVHAIVEATAAAFQQMYDSRGSGI